MLCFLSPPFVCLSKSTVKMSPPAGSHWGPYGESCPFPEPSLAYPSGSTVKEPILQVPLTELPFPEPSPSVCQESPVNEPPSLFPNGAPMEKEIPFSRAFFYTTPD